MSVLENQPPKNLLQNQGFQMVLRRAPSIVYHVQKAPIPGMEMGVIYVPGPVTNYPVPGDHMKFDDLEVSFKVDEDLANYLEIYSWIQGLGHPDSYQEYADLAAQPDQFNIFSDITILIDDAKRNANFEVVFQDAFPSSLSGITFDSTLQDIPYMLASARFVYNSHKINKI